MGKHFKKWKADYFEVTRSTGWWLSIKWICLDSRRVRDELRLLLLQLLLLLLPLLLLLLLSPTQHRRPSYRWNGTSNIDDDNDVETFFGPAIDQNRFSLTLTPTLLILSVFDAFIDLRRALRIPNKVLNNNIVDVSEFISPFPIDSTTFHMLCRWK